MADGLYKEVLAVKLVMKRARSRTPKLDVECYRVHLSRLQIKNFRNFKHLDLALAGNAVILGENRVGKSNLLFALRLVLDSSLPDSARALKLSDFWDGVKIGNSPEIRVDVDLSDFDDSDALAVLLTDYRLNSAPKTARLSYVYRPRANLATTPRSEADYEFFICGGDEEARLKSNVRRRLAVDVLSALRDAEAELANWRSSPLRPLIDDAASRVPEEELKNIASRLDAATDVIHALKPIEELERDLRDRISKLSGAAQDANATLAFASTDSIRVLRTLSLFIDNGARSISDASLGSANLALLALRLAELNWRSQKNERNYTFVCIEEPEAHLHPQLQRQAFEQIFSSNAQDSQSLLLTTHSPTIASVSPWRAITILRKSNDGTIGYSLANLQLSTAEQEDLGRYLRGERAEIFFSRAIIFVEGDAEQILIPRFAKWLHVNLDELGISICSVGGTHFSAYVKLATAINVPFAVITDWDPSPHKKALGWKRTADLIQSITTVRSGKPMTPVKFGLLLDDEIKLRASASSAGIFLNDSTLETELARSDLAPRLIGILLECDLSVRRLELLQEWQTDTSKIEGDELMACITNVGKGRFAGRLKSIIESHEPPKYISDAIRHIEKQCLP